MADESFSVDTDGLHAQMPYLRELAGRFQSVGTNLEAKLHALGQPWGSDETGRQFYESYAGPHQQILTGISETGEVLESTGDGIETMAKNYQIVEDQNAAAARSLHTGGQQRPEPSGVHEKP